jgi:hypothetical protein
MAPVLKALIVGMVLGAIVFAFIQIVPVYVKSYEFRQAARKEARLAAFNAMTEDSIRGDLYEKAQELGLPVERAGIKVGSTEIDGNASLTDLMDPVAHKITTGLVDIDVSYDVPVEFPGYTLRLKFRVHADERSV